MGLWENKKNNFFYRYKHGGANVKCTMCDTTFAHEVKLKAHMKNVHTYVVSQTFEKPSKIKLLLFTRCFSSIRPVISVG